MDQSEIESLAREIQQRRRSRPGPKKMADVLSSLLASRGYAQQQDTQRRQEVWRDVAGAKFAKQSCAGNIRRGVLEVIVSNSAVLQELTFQKKKLVRRLSEVAPEQQIRDLRFRVGAID